MVFSRRQMVRDLTLASMAAASGPLKAASRIVPDWGRSGIRVIFGGGWIFCDHFAKKPGYMCAVAVNMPKFPHHFPYGPWTETSMKDWKNDTTHTELPGGKAVSSVVLQQGGQPWQPTLDVYTLFQQTHANGPFTEIKANGSKPYAIQDWSNPDLRVVELPIPSRILPTAIRMDVTLAGVSTYCKPDQFKGIAFSEIFMYDEADTMSFSQLGSVRIGGSPSSSSDFLIQTMPDHAMYGPGHATDMFKAMLTLVDPTLAKNLVVTVPVMSVAPVPGPSVPSGISPEEQNNILDPMRTIGYGVGSPMRSGNEPQKVGMLGDFPTCGSGSAALGN